MSKLTAMAAAILFYACSAPAFSGTNAGSPGAAPEMFEVQPQFIVGKPRIYTAVVNFDGILWRGTAGTKAFLDMPATFEVDFFNAGVPVDVRFCSYNATLGGVSVLIPVPGMVATAQRSGVNNGVWVRTWDAFGNLEPRAFHLTVTCP